MALTGRVLILAGVLLVSRASAQSDACTLLTAAEVSQTLGVTVRQGVHIPELSKITCGWSVSDPPKIDEPKVVVSIKTVDSFNTGKTPVPNIQKAPVSGVGDEAYSATVPPFGTTLSVRKGKTAFSVSVRGTKLKLEQVQELEKKLATVVLGRI